MDQNYPPPGGALPPQGPPPGYSAPALTQYGQQHAYPGQQPVYVVQQQEKKNGLALAAMILGIIGVAMGLIPLFFFVAFVLGTLALIFGLIGRGKQRRTRRKMAWSGIILGLVALALGVVGVVIVNNVVDDVDDCLEAISDDLENGTDRSDAACD